MTDEFNDPGQGGDKLPLAELDGSLLIFTVHAHEHGITTSFGEKDAIRCDIAAVDGTHRGETWPDALVFPGGLIGALKGSIGGKVIGRLGKGTPKPGQQAPWVLSAATAEEKASGAAYLQHVASQQLGTPAAEPAPAAAAQW